MTDDQPDLFELRAARDAGIDLATDHAEAVDPGWTDRAVALLDVYADLRPSGFTTLELRTWAREVYGFVGVTNWAWGGVLTRAQKLGLVKQVGARAVGDSTSHLKLSPVWRRPGLGEK